MEMLRRTLTEEREKIAMVALSGPGDPLATPDITLHAIRKIREYYPDLKIGLKTFGLGSSKLATDLALAGADYLQVIIDAIDPDILKNIYAWIRPGQKTLKISNAVDLLIKEQRRGVPALKSAGLDVSIQTTLYPGYNLDHALGIGIEMANLGADGISLIPFCSVPGAEVELASPGDDSTTSIMTAVNKHLQVMEPLIVEQTRGAGEGTNGPGKNNLLQPGKEKPNVAVVSSNGIEVDLHLGQAIRFLVYGPNSDGLICLIESRAAPEPGAGKDRWQEVSRVLADCFVLLVASAGEAPRRALAQKGLQVLITEDNIEGIVDVLYGGGKKAGKKALEV